MSAPAINGADQQRQQDEQLLLNDHGKQQQHHQAASFLIPMAVIQGEPAEPAPSQPQQADAAGFGGHAPRAEGGPRAAQRSPMQLYQQLMLQQQQQQRPAVNHAGSLINQGFMSSFLLAEKEKLSAAAARQLPTASFPPPPPQPVATFNNGNNNNSNSPQSQPKQQVQQVAPQSGPNGAGGLMPSLMMAFSMMPDNMIGQAYNAAVGQALPLESGRSLRRCLCERSLGGAPSARANVRGLAAGDIFVAAREANPSREKGRERERGWSARTRAATNRDN